MIMEPPCKRCKYAHLPKMGKYLGTDGRISTMGRYRSKRKLVKNPCYACKKPQEYADWLESLFVMAPTNRQEQTQYVGGNILDKSVLQGIE